MFRMKVEIGDYILTTMQDLSTSVQPIFRDLLQTDVKPAVQKSVEKHLATYPPPREKLPPFEFASDRSRKAYFATNGFGKGIPYKRTNTLAKGWDTKVSSKFSNNLITISNVQPYSTYVYGPRQIPGHAQTGWGKDFDKMAGVIQDDAEEAIVKAWGKAWDTVVKG